MAKRALLVGCNYPGTQAALRGCVNDVWGTKEMLITYLGFAEADMTVMLDTDPAYTSPTGKNIKAKLAELISISQDGDVLVFHFSGHGTQVPSDDPNEKDAKDEAICPTDMNLISDSDLRQILSPLKSKPKVKFTMLADCCHSGTMLDQPTVVITGPKPGGPAPPAIDVQAIQDMLASLGGGGGANRDIKNRALPIQDVTAFLSQLLGQPVGQGNIRSAMVGAFGQDASARAVEYVKYINMAQQAFNMISGNKTGAGGAGGAGAAGGCGSILGMLTMCLGGGGAAAGGMQQQTAAGQGAAGMPAAAHAGAKPPPGERLPEDIGILVTGCQDKETSADVTPGGNPNNSHGAMSHALHTAVKAHYTTQPDQPLTNRNLVIAIRDALAKAGFAQNPCLECGHHHADDRFILH